MRQRMSIIYIARVLVFFCVRRQSAMSRTRVSNAEAGAGAFTVALRGVWKEKQNQSILSVSSVNVFRC